MNPESDSSKGTEVIYHDFRALTTTCVAEVLLIKHINFNCIEVLFCFRIRGISIKSVLVSYI